MQLTANHRGDRTAARLPPFGAGRGDSSHWLIEEPVLSTAVSPSECWATPRVVQRLRPWIVVVLGLPSGCADPRGAVANSCGRTVSLPRVALGKGGRIQSVEIAITGAWFTAVHRIPLDGAVEVRSPGAGVSTLHGEAGIGSERPPR